MIGKTLGHYQITSQLGKGGMGEVFQAKDQILGRDVAIKVLPEEFAKDSDRVARFQREAKLLASLNHPNIAAIYDLEESAGTNFLVLELVEGQTLADRIKQGPIPVEESLKLALQIAEALEAAHDKGVIHRDLKPANIKVTPDGKVKVLDFGLAKAYAGEQAESSLSASPTLSNLATQQGIILGTAAYMSPEQASGKSIDKRADIWAFGVVLFEMLTGRSLFAGDNVSQTLARVLERQPDFSLLPSNLKPKVGELLRRCLQKESKNRYHDIADIRLDLQEVLSEPGGVFVQPVRTAEPRRLRTMLPWVAALVLAAIISGLAVWKLKPTEPRQVMRFSYELPEDQQFGDLARSVLAISPDGRQLVYSTSKGLYLRPLDDCPARLIPGSEGDTEQPLFSPDGKWIGYFSVSDRQLKKIPINGGAPVTLCAVKLPLGMWWDTDDTIVYGQYMDAIMRVSAKGGNPKPVVAKAKSGGLAQPQILPGGKSILYIASNAPVLSQFRLMWRPVESGEPKGLYAGVGPRYLSTGHIVYAVGNNLVVAPFDPDRPDTEGSGPISMIEGVYGIASPQYAVSDSGTLVYLPGPSGAALTNQCTLVWVDRNGKEEPIAAPPNDYRVPKISPDGSKLALTLAVSSSTDNSDIWIWDISREVMTPLTLNGRSSVPLWTHDGRRIVFRSFADSPGVYWKKSDGTGEEERLASAQDHLFYPWSWSRDGKTLLLSDYALPEQVGTNIGVLSMEGDRKWNLLLKEKYTENEPQISPDGQWMAYTSNESGQYEVYIRPFPEVNKKRELLSKGGGHLPLWSPDGREVFYRNEDSVMSVSVQTEPKFEVGKPNVLFRGKYISRSPRNVRPWDISPDGKRFLMLKPTPTTGEGPAAEGPRKINIVVNWFEELRQRVPVK